MNFDIFLVILQPLKKKQLNTNKYDDSKRNPRLIQELLRVERTHYRTVSPYGYQRRPYADVHQRRNEPMERHHSRHS